MRSKKAILTENIEIVINMKREKDSAKINEAEQRITFVKQNKLNKKKKATKQVKNKDKNKPHKNFNERLKKTKQPRKTRENDDLSSDTTDSTVTLDQSIEDDSDFNQSPLQPSVSEKKRNRRKNIKCKSKRADEKKVFDNYLAIDCEMVGVGKNGDKSVVARVSIVNWHHDILLDTYVKVSEPITDYRTNVSGIKPEHVNSSDAMDFEVCQKIVEKMICGKILVGHGLKSDLQALQLSHPWFLTRDTAKFEPYMKHNYEGNLVARKLRDLADEILHVSIQNPGEVHNPIVDAYTALELYKSVQRKWEKTMAWKVKKTEQIVNMKVIEGKGNNGDVQEKYLQ